jgi:hypothetical protein
LFSLSFINLGTNQVEPKNNHPKINVKLMTLLF